MKSRNSYPIKRICNIPPVEELDLSALVSGLPYCIDVFYEQCNENFISKNAVKYLVNWQLYIPPTSTVSKS